MRTARLLTVSHCILCTSPPKKTTHAPWKKPCMPPKKPCMSPQKNHTPVRKNHAYPPKKPCMPPQKTMHAPWKKPCMPPKKTMYAPRKKPCMPPPLWTEWHTRVKILPCPKLRLRAVKRDEISLVVQRATCLSLQCPRRDLRKHVTCSPFSNYSEAKIQYGSKFRLLQIYNRTNHGKTLDTDFDTLRN